uniref:Uncharacterized protein n=1 Tax=Aegilops tauschii subsp. strangulata TaxID=200361 RepID=A0A452XZ53_AEGTS
MIIIYSVNFCISSSGCSILVLNLRLSGYNSGWG